MSNIIRNAFSLLSNPAMIRSYLAWLASRALGGSPRHEIAPGVWIGEWINFSEYRSYTTASGILPGEEIYARRALLRGGAESVAFDVGANIGIFTCFLASIDQVQVHSFEPIVNTFCRLQKNVFKNHLAGKCSLNCLAVGSGYDLVTFRLFDHSPGLNRLARDTIAVSENADCYQRVVTVSLDDYCDKLGIQKIDFLKVDAEGMEPVVLAGAKRLMSKKAIKTILMEVCPANLHAVGFEPSVLYKSIRDIGYKPFFLTNDGNVGKEFRFETLQEKDSPNIVLVPE